MKEKLYFTAGELAELYGIPKQTMLYYDKMGILQPEFIAENGYRHYDVPQYLTLEIIIFLRKLNIPISRIQKFLENKNPDTLNILLNEKEQECHEIIEEAQKIRSSLKLFKQQLERNQQILLDQILLEYQQEKQFCVTPVDKKQAGRERVEVIAKHVQKVFSQAYFKEKSVGWIVAKSDFFGGNYNNSLAFFSAASPENELKINNFTRPTGLYLNLNFRGTYYNKAPEISKNIQNFLDRNELKAIGDIFVTPLNDHWVSNCPDEYINKISLQVEKRQ